MASLKDRESKRTEEPTKETVKAIVNPKAKTKYAVNIIFDGSDEELIRNAAAQRGLGVATYIKSLVLTDARNK